MSSRWYRRAPARDFAARPRNARGEIPIGHVRVASSWRRRASRRDRPQAYGRWRRSDVLSRLCARPAKPRARSAARRQPRRRLPGRADPCGGPHSSPLSWIEAPLRCFMVILQADQQSFQQAQRTQRRDQDQRRPKHRVQPERRLINEFDDQRGDDHDKTADEDREYRGAIAGIRETEIEATGIAPGAELQEATEQLSVSATRTATGDPLQNRKGKRSLEACNHFRTVTLKCREPAHL